MKEERNEGLVDQTRLLVNTDEGGKRLSDLPVPLSSR